MTVPAVPAIYGLDDPDDRLQSWVFALPDGQALIVPAEGEATGLIHTSLDRLVRRWAPLRGADLVLVTAESRAKNRRTAVATKDR